MCKHTCLNCGAETHEPGAYCSQKCHDEMTPLILEYANKIRRWMHVNNRRFDMSDYDCNELLANTYYNGLYPIGEPDFLVRPQAD